MKTMIIVCSMVLLLSAFAGITWAGTEGNSNTFYGRGAGNGATGDDDSDTFVGYQAGYATTGAANTFVGYQAGYANTTGLGNTFLGYYAGYSNTTANANTFVGDYAGWKNTTGYRNTFLGEAAGRSNTTGESNTFVGNIAGYYNTTGAANTFMGYQAGYANTTGLGNTFLGYYAGSSNTTGYANTCLGVYAGWKNTTGYWNTFLGEAAGRSNTTGYYNTFVGLGAGYYNTTGLGNVFLGYFAGRDETGSNKLYIANSETATPLIYGEFDNRTLTINGNLRVVAPDNGLIRLTDVTDDNTDKSARMVLDHYANGKSPVYIFNAASTAADNLVAIGGGDKIGNAATQIDLYTAPTATTPAGTPRITIVENGYVGIGTQRPEYPLQMAGGAYSDGRSWYTASSREYKEHIRELPVEDAVEALAELNPVTFNYKASSGEGHVGFIAEEVPELIATKDRKGLSPMDIVAVLTKVVQEQQKTISGLTKELNALKKEVEGKRVDSTFVPSSD